MANEIKLDCMFRESDSLEVLEIQGKLYFQTDAFEEHLQEDCSVVVCATPEDAIKFAEKVIVLAKEIKGVEKYGGK